MATQSIPDFAPKVEKYAVHNARPEALDFMWGGVRMTVPGVAEISSKPAHFDNGDPIPGTLVISDGYVLNTDGTIPTGGPPNWSAKEALRAVLGVAPNGEANSQLALNGVSFLPMGCSREAFEVIKESGDFRYRESLITWANDTLQNYEEGRNRAKQAGVNPKPPGADFYKAQAILQVQQEKMKQQYGSPEQVSEENETLFEIYAKAQALKMAGNIAEEVGVDKAKLVEKMLEDPKISAQIRKKYSLRKRGYMDPTDAPGAPQPEAESFPE